MVVVAIYAGDRLGQQSTLFVSKDGGQSFLQDHVAGSADWAAVAVSGDGSVVVAQKGADDFGRGGIYTSRRGGLVTSFFPFDDSTLLFGDWASAFLSTLYIVYSTSGSIVALQRESATGEPGFIYSSTDAGHTWYRGDYTGSAYWAAVTGDTLGYVHVAVQSALDASETPGTTWISYDWFGNGDYIPTYEGDVMGYWSDVALAETLLGFKIILGAQDKDQDGNPGSLYLAKQDDFIITGQFEWTRASAPQAQWSSVELSSE